MKVVSDFVTGSGKGIEEVGAAHWKLQMRRDQYIYENYFHFRVESDGHCDEAIIDIYPDQDFLPESRRILDTHFSPATLWWSEEGPFTERSDGWHPHPSHLIEWGRDHMRLRVWLEPDTIRYFSSHHPLAPNYWLAKLRRKAEICPNICHYRAIGTTPEGQEIGCLAIGGGEDKIVIMAAEHPIETPGSWAAWGIIDYLTSNLPEVCELRRRHRFECLPVVNPDGLGHGNACFNSSGVDLFQAYAGAKEGLFPAEEARLLWQYLTAEIPALLLNFHCYMGGSQGQDYPNEGHYMIPAQEWPAVFSAAAGRIYRSVNERVMFATDAKSWHYDPAPLFQEALCYQLALRHDVPSLFYEFNGGFNGPYRNMRNGVRVFEAALLGLGEGMNAQ